MSVERLTHRRLWRLVWWRLVGDLIGVPRRILECAASCVMQLEQGVFYLELDAARQYEALTGVDMGFASGNPNRYVMVLDEEADDGEF